jgi:hypothetical protein
MLELVVVLKSDKYNEIIKLYRDTLDLNFHIERDNELRPFITDAKTLDKKVRDVDDWLHLLIDELGYEVLDVPFERKTKEELISIIKDRLDAMLDRSLDYYKKYAFVYFERYILDKHYLEWLFENFEVIRKIRRDYDG